MKIPSNPTANHPVLTIVNPQSTRKIESTTNCDSFFLIKLERIMKWKNWCSHLIGCESIFFCDYLNNYRHDLLLIINCNCIYTVRLMLLPLLISHVYFYFFAISFLLVKNELQHYFWILVWIRWRCETIACTSCCDSKFVEDFYGMSIGWIFQDCLEIFRIFSFYWEFGNFFGIFELFLELFYRAFQGNFLKSFLKLYRELLRIVFWAFWGAF